MRPSLLSAICSTLLLAYVLRAGRYLDFPSPYILIYLVCSHLSKAGMHSSVEYFTGVWTMDREKKRTDRSTFSNLQLSKYSLPITHSYVGWFARFIKSMVAFWLRLNPYHSNSIVHALFQHAHTKTDPRNNVSRMGNMRASWMFLGKCFLVLLTFIETDRLEFSSR